MAGERRANPAAGQRPAAGAGAALRKYQPLPGELRRADSQPPPHGRGLRRTPTRDGQAPHHPDSGTRTARRSPLGSSGAPPGAANSLRARGTPRCLAAPPRSRSCGAAPRAAWGCRRAGRHPPPDVTGTGNGPPAAETAPVPGPPRSVILRRRRYGGGWPRGCCCAEVDLCEPGMSALRGLTRCSAASRSLRHAQSSST
jgi:hypothetical protein